MHATFVTQRVYLQLPICFHVIVSDNGNYTFQHIASKDISEQLWKKHAAHMTINLNEMFSVNPNEISRHLYGYQVFSHQHSHVGIWKMVAFHVYTTKPIKHYYELLDDDTFPAIESQGMFQFTARNCASCSLCNAFHKTNKLYFVNHSVYVTLV